MSKEEFVELLMAHFVLAGLRLSDTLDLAGSTLVNFLECEEVEFGDPEYEWNNDLALRIVTEEMSYWEG